MGNRLTTIDRFQVKNVLGEGGQGTVYLAYDPKLNREVAIKTLAAGNGGEAQKLLDEARAVGALRHPCIVPVFEAGCVDGMTYLVFEYVTGETLQQLIARNGGLPADSALRIMERILDGLAHAHRNGVLHRDIKPANIMLGRDGTPRIMDFGAASRNRLNWLNGANVAVDGDFIGTPAYMAPEYIEKREFSARTDIYAAGLVLCEMLTGQRMFKANGGGLDELFDKIVNEPVTLPPGPGLNERTVACLLKALARNPDERYDSVVAMKEKLLATDDAMQKAESAAEGGTLEFLLRRMKLKKEFPALSESVSRINGIIFSDKGSITALTNAVLKDFALTSKIIRLANSAYYNPKTGSTISTISSAIYRLGFDTIRNIVLGLLLFDQMKDRNQARDLMGECVQAILGGAIAKEICVARGVGNPEETFICSMMHNLGRMLSLYNFPEETEEIRKVLQLGQAGEDQASKQILGASYTELGQGVAKFWGFPEAIIDSMDKRPPPAASREKLAPAESLRLIACMASELSTVAVTCNPDQQKARTAETLEKYKGHLKLSQKAVDGIFSRSAEKLKDYTKAVGWEIDQSMAKRIGLMQAKPEDPVSVENGEITLTDAATTLDIEKTMQLHVKGKETPPAAPTERPQVSSAVLSGGIQDITNALVEGCSLSDILRIIIETIYSGIGFDHVIFAVRDPRQGVMLGRFGLGHDVDGLVERFRFPLQFVPDVFHVALQRNIDVFFTDTGDPKIVNRIPQWYRDTFSAGTFMLFPVVVKDKPFGIIYADAAAANSVALQESELKLLRTLRNQAVLAVRQSV